MKKICFTVLMISCLCTSIAHAKGVTSKTVTDSNTGNKILYFDLGESTTRAYFTQNMWFNDNDSFAVCTPSDGQIYRYSISSNKAEALFEQSELPIDAGTFITPDNTIYGIKNGCLYKKKISSDIQTVPTDTLSMTLPLLEGYQTNSEREIATTAEEYTENGLTFALITNDRWRATMTVAREKGGKWCRTTVARNANTDRKGGALWYEISTWNNGNDGKALRNILSSSYHTFRVDSSRLSTNTRNVTIEFDYYDNADSNFLNNCDLQVIYRAMNDNGTVTTKTKNILIYSLDDKWKTVKVTLDDACFDHGGNDNGFKFDFRLGNGYNRGGLAVTNVKVYETPAGGVENLGYVQGGWHPHVSHNGDVSLTTGNAQNAIIYDAETKKVKSTAVGVNSAHTIINPVYPNLVLYTYDHTGDSNINFNRIRVLNRDTGEMGCIFDQYSNSSNGATTGEAVGHENWTADGEYIVAVKYDYDTNIGRRGIIRMDKNGENREYINGDYDYWHCSPSPDGRWVVADTIPRTEYVYIVLIDTKTGKSHLVARQKAFQNDPGQPHPSFSPDGKKITFAMAANDSTSVVGVGVVDVSGIVNDGQIAEPTAPSDFRLAPFTIGFNKELNRNEVSTTVDNIDGATRAMNLYSAVYDKEGKLVSSNVSRYSSSDDATISTEIDDVDKGETLKCFLWDDNNTPIKSSTDTIKLLRVAKSGPNSLVLSWQHETDIPVIRYEVFRNDEKIGQTPDTVYRDYGLANEKQYTYYVRPIYSGFHVGEDGAFINAKIADLDFEGTNYDAPGSTVTGTKAGIKASTTYSEVSVLLKKNNTVEKGLHFVMNGANSSLDGYTKPESKGFISSKDCRKSTSDAASMFCFKFNKDIISEDVKSYDITVEYYNSGGGDLNLWYRATDGTQKTAKIASLSSYGMSWTSKTITISDAKFDGSLNRNADFVIKPTKADVCIYSVTVTPKAASTINSDRQYVEWTTTEANGLGRVSGGEISGEFVCVNGSDARVKFTVDDTYMYGSGNNMAWIDITYKDQGTGNIYLYYNTSDPTAQAQTSDKKAQTVITCADTGELKTARIPLIDAGFSNYDGYDFMIGADNTAYISKVHVFGY